MSFRPDLRRSDDPREVLDRAGAEERVPVVLPRLEREARRREERPGALRREATPELGEAEVVADPDPAPPERRQLERADAVERAGPERGALALRGPVRDLDVEQVDLIFLLGILRYTLRLLDIAHEMTEGILPSVAETDGPASGRRSARKDPAAGAKRRRSGRFATAT